MKKAVGVISLPLMATWLLFSSCTLMYPCGSGFEYCVEDDCVCGLSCARQDCVDLDHVCVGYLFDDTTGVCVDRRYQDRHGLPLLDGIADGETGAVETGDRGTSDGEGDGGTEDTACFEQWTGIHPGGNFWECDAMIDCDAIDAAWDHGLAADEAALVDLVNAIRAEPQTCGQSERAAVGSLEHMPLMRCASRLHAWDQQHRDYYGHSCPDGNGPAYRMAKTGAGSSASENIYMTTMGPEGTVQGWMDSPGHCDIIMNSSKNHIGVGRYGGHWVMKLI